MSNRKNKKRNSYTRTKSAVVAMDREIRRQVQAANAAYELELDALALWTLHDVYGFGPDRLERFYEALLRERAELHEHYTGEVIQKSQNEPGIEYTACRYKLKEYGFDVDEAYTRLSKKYQIKG